MKLYVNESRTQWAGTQADAKKELGKFDAWDVPVDKSGLLEFLNNFGLTPPSKVIADEQRPVVNHSSDVRPPSNTFAGRCNLVELKELSTMLLVLINKTWSEQEKQEGV